MSYVLYFGWLLPLLLALFRRKELLWRQFTGIWLACVLVMLAYRFGVPLVSKIPPAWLGIVILGWLPAVVVAGVINSINDRAGTIVAPIVGVWMIVGAGLGLVWLLGFPYRNQAMWSVAGAIVTIVAINWWSLQKILPAETMVLRLRAIVASDLSTYKFMAGVSFIIPLVVAVPLFARNASVAYELVQQLHSGCFSTITGLMALVATFSIFVIEVSANDEVVDFLTASTKRLGALCFSAIIVSLLAQPYLPDSATSPRLVFSAASMTFEEGLHGSMLISAMSLALASIWLTLIVYRQTVDLLRREKSERLLISTLAETKEMKFLFDERECWVKQDAGECSVGNTRSNGCSLLREHIERQDQFVHGQMNGFAKDTVLRMFDIVVALSRKQPYTDKEIESLATFIAGGGNMIVAVDNADARRCDSLLMKFGLRYFSDGYLAYESGDEVIIPLEISDIEADFANVAKVSSVKTGRFGAIDCSNCSGMRILIGLPNTLYLERRNLPDIKPNQIPSAPGGGFPFAVISEYGNGRVAVFSAQMHWTNDLFNECDNRALWDGLVKLMSNRSRDSASTPVQETSK